MLLDLPADTCLVQFYFFETNTGCIQQRPFYFICTGKAAGFKQYIFSEQYLVGLEANLSVYFLSSMC